MALFKIVAYTSNYGLFFSMESEEISVLVLLMDLNTSINFL